MTDIAWPVEFVDDTGATHLAHDMAGAWGLVYGGCLLKRAVEGLPFKVSPAAAPPPAGQNRDTPNPSPKPPTTGRPFERSRRPE